MWDCRHYYHYQSEHFSYGIIARLLKMYIVCVMSCNNISAYQQIGMNVGGGFSPYIATALWGYTSLGPSALFVSILSFMLLSLVVWVTPLCAHGRVK